MALSSPQVACIDPGHLIVPVANITVNGCIIHSLICLFVGSCSLPVFLLGVPYHPEQCLTHIRCLVFITLVYWSLAHGPAFRLSVILLPKGTS